MNNNIQDPEFAVPGNLLIREPQRPVVVKGPRVRVAKYAMIATAIYVTCFFPLWLGGGYVVQRSGRTRFLNTIAIADTIDWQPLWGNCQPEYQWPGGNPNHWGGGEIAPRCDFIGWAYYPLWLLAKKKHPTYALMEKDGLPFNVVKPTELPTDFKLHPLHEREMREIFSLINK